MSNRNKATLLRMLLVLILVLGQMFILSVVTKAQAESEEESTINSLGQQNPSIYKNLVVWEDYRHGNADIYMLDTSRGQEIRLTFDEHYQGKPVVFGNKIVWEDYRHGHGAIYLYDVTQQKEMKLTSADTSADQFNPDIYENMVVWEDYRNGYSDIFMYDLVTEQERRLTSTEGHHLHPSIWGNMIVWEERGRGQSAIFSMDLSANAVRKLSDDHQLGSNPTIHGNNIVWEEQNVSGRSIVIYDYIKQIKRQIGGSESSKHNPSISGNKLVWEDYRDGNINVYLYDLVHNTTATITGEGDQFHPVIDGDTVVWEEHNLWEGHNQKPAKLMMHIIAKPPTSGDGTSPSGTNLEESTEINFKSLTTVVNEGNGTTLVTVREDLALTILVQGKASSKVIIPVVSTSDAIQVQLSPQLIQTMIEKNMVLEIQTPLGAYSIPCWYISNFGGRPLQVTNAGDGMYQISISRLTNQALEKLGAEASRLGLKLVTEPIEFSLARVKAGQITDLRDFGGYVTLTLPVKSGLTLENLQAVKWRVGKPWSPVPVAFRNEQGRASLQLKYTAATGVYVVAKKAVDFTDINTHWAKDEIRLLVSRGVLQGMPQGKFAPDNAITRAQLAVVLTKALGLQERTGLAFRDVHDNHWASEGVHTASNWGLLQGYPDGTFRPDQPVSREELMVIIARCLKLMEHTRKIQTQETLGILQGFKDGEKVKLWAREAVALSIEERIMQGNNGLLAPEDSVTRGQLAAIIHRMLKLVQFI